MTDRTDHYLAAQGALADAREWARQAGELSPEASELTSLAYAAVHALLAIHDTLTAADRYAANEERQREEAEPDTPSGRAFTARDKDAMDAVQAKINALGEWLPAMEKALTPEYEPDPLDEDDHRDRVTPNGTEWRRTIAGCWHPTASNVQSHRRPRGSRCHWSLAFVQSLHGPLSFAPDADGAPSVTAPVADDPGDDAVDGEEGERRYLNAQTSSGDHEQQEH